MDILPCTVSPDRKGRFSLGIVNHMTQDLELGREIVLGRLSEVLHLGLEDAYALDPSKQLPCYGIWQIASHTWSDPEVEEMSGMHTVKVSTTLFLEEKGKSSKVDGCTSIMAY